MSSLVQRVRGTSMIPHAKSIWWRQCAVVLKGGMLKRLTPDGVTRELVSLLVAVSIAYKRCVTHI